jgi:hypothetical protein
VKKNAIMKKPCSLFITFPNQVYMTVKKSSLWGIDNSKIWIRHLLRADHKSSLFYCSILNAFCSVNRWCLIFWSLFLQHIFRPRANPKTDFTPFDICINKFVKCNFQADSCAQIFVESPSDLHSFSIQKSNFCTIKTVHKSSTKQSCFLKFVPNIFLFRTFF